jgi:hypothetical protein
VMKSGSRQILLAVNCRCYSTISEEAAEDAVRLVPFAFQRQLPKPVCNLDLCFSIDHH